MSVDVDFERWAEISARLRRVAPADRARWLASEGVHDWETANRLWCQRIINDIATGDLERAMRYSDVCSREGTSPIELPAEASTVDASRVVPIAPIAESAPVAHAIASAAVGAAPQDFRAEVMFEARTPVADPALAAAATDEENFRARMAPPGPLPAAPIPGQAATETAVDLAALRTAQTAVAWPIDTYAKLCAELDIDGDRIELVCAHYGITASVLGPVHALWTRRLQANPAQHHAWYDAMQRYRQQFAARRSLRER
jgi:hypothetical protein